MPISVQHVTFPTDDARQLVGELDAVLNADSPPENQHGYSIERIFQPGVMFFVARLAEEPVGCGAVAFDDGYGEVKRMYVRPAARGKNVAQAIMARLEEEARSRGVGRLTLETGDNRYAAMKFYEREGFTRCGPFGPYLKMEPRAIARSVFFEKPLT